MSHPYPRCDCQGSSIEGFEHEKKFAEKVLSDCGVGGKAMLLFELSDKRYLYGQSNFKLAEWAPCPWKFIRTFRELVEHDVLYRLHGDGHHLSAIFFLDADLRAKFVDYPAMEPYVPLFKLVKRKIKV